jgi:hypothetical protein
VGVDERVVRVLILSGVQPPDQRDSDCHDKQNARANLKGRALEERGFGVFFLVAVLFIVCVIFIFVVLVPLATGTIVVVTRRPAAVVVAVILGTVIRHRHPQKPGRHPWNL